MMRRFCIAAMGVMTAASMLFAQNARVDAMGGCDIIDDIISTASIAADMNNYSDNIQATGTAGGFGPFIGIKGIGDMLNLGVLGNNGGVLNNGLITSPFYEDAVAQVNSGLQAGTPILSDPLPPIPHLLLGIDLDAFKLGLDFFVEMARTTYKQEITGTGARTANDKGVVYNVGGKISANIEAGDATISPLVGFGIPRIKQKSEIEISPTTTTTEELSEKGLYFTGGVRAGLPVADLDWVVGAFYSYEVYQWLSKAAGVDTKSNEFPNHFINAYVGFSTEVLEQLFVVTQYSFLMGILGEKSETVDAPVAGATTETNDRELVLYHKIAGGLERVVGDVWIFDELTGRAGVALVLKDSTYKQNSDISGTQTSELKSRESMQIEISSVSPTVGLGLKKGKFSFDIVSNLAAWTGIVSGPPVVEGTITFNFGSSSSSSSSTSSSTPSYESSAPASSTDSGTSTDTESSTTTDTQTAPASSGSGFEF